MTEELKPCRCGERPSIVIDQDVDMKTDKSYRTYYVKCHKCSPRCNKLQEAVEHWNRRAKDD